MYFILSKILLFLILPLYWVIIMVLFGTTGILQIIYQNEPPIEPRERDYATACSFLVYTIWMGFGVIGLI